MREFGTQGPVNSEDHYVVSRSEELADYINRVKQGRYIVLFAPRQSGKTTFFQEALKRLAKDESAYFPIHLNFEAYKNRAPDAFYTDIFEDIREEIEDAFENQGITPSQQLMQFLDDTKVSDHVAMLRFFRQLPRLLCNELSTSLPPRLVVIIDEFDGIPQAAVSDFLHTLRRIYLTRRDTRSLYSVGIVGVKNITQLDYDRSISPFNIQDDFTLPNFTAAQVGELLSQYTDEVGQAFAQDVIDALHRQTAGQPFLVNRCAQILTTALDIPKTDTIQMHHFSQAYAELIAERNTNIEHLITNIRRNPRFEKMLMQIAFYGSSINFTLHDEIVSELATYGIIARGEDGRCQICNPIYLHCIIQALRPLINGLEDQYFPEEGPIDFTRYITSTGQIQMHTLLNNFNAFIARAGFRILQVPDTPKEFVGQYLLFAYLDEFVKIVRATMRLEVPTGRGRADIIISHNRQQYIIETKVWRNEKYYQGGKHQLAAYLKSEGATEGYYIVFDHREDAKPRLETDTLDGLTIRSYVIPVVQKRPSDVQPESQFS